jgi:hypothetical protein
MCVPPAAYVDTQLEEKVMVSGRFDTNFVFTPAKLTVVLDGGAGSSGKGKLSSFICEHADRWQFACNTFMPQAGHTVKLDDGRSYFYQTFNSCAYLTDRYEKIYLGPGATIELPAFYREIEENNIPPGKIGISPLTSILQNADSDFEKGLCDLAGKPLSDAVQSDQPGGYLAKTGTTAHGCGANRARRTLRHPEAKYARDLPELAEFICDVPGEIMTRLDLGQAGLLEVAQGFQLSYLLPNFFPYCLSGDSRVLMADGTTKKIRDLKDCIGQHVRTRGVDGRMTTKPIVNWWCKPLGDRKWYNVVTATSAFSEYDNAWRGAKFTGDHLFDTPNGQKKTTDLKCGDRVYTADRVLIGDAMQVFLGSMLGDGSVCAVKKSPARASFQITHCEKQGLYCRAKAKLMEHCVPTGGVRELVYGVKSFKPGAKGVRYESVWSRTVREAAEKYGCYGKKSPNMEQIVEDIDWRGLAIWYQDDGRLKKIAEKRHAVSMFPPDERSDRPLYRTRRSGGYDVTLYTNGFTWSECSRLAAALALKFGLHFSVVKGQKGLPTLMLSRHDHDRWFTNLLPYMHPAMAYKLPERFSASERWTWNDHNDAPLAAEEVLTVEECRPTDRGGHGVCFDIEIADTHNFFVSNDKGYISTHNCTSRNCTVAAALDDLMVAPCYAGNVILNFRTFPIRINNNKYIKSGTGQHLTWQEVQALDQLAASRGLTDKVYDVVEGNSGPGYGDQEETSWERLTAASGAPQPIMEMTSVTKLPRRVFTFSRQNVRDAVRHNRANGETWLALNFANYVDHGLTGTRTRAETITSEIVGPRMIEWLSRYIMCTRRLRFIGTGPKTDDMILIGNGR